MKVHRYRLAVERTNRGARHRWAWTVEWFCVHRWVVKANGHAWTRDGARAKAGRKARYLVGLHNPSHYEEQIAYSVPDSASKRAPDPAPAVTSRLGCKASS